MIWIDDREGSSKLLEPLRKLGAECELRRLEYGDACWSGNGPRGPCLVGAEYKTVTDLLQSMRTGRLCGHQLPGMSVEYMQLYLIVEGIVRSDPHSGILQQFRYGKWTDVRVGQQKFMWRDYESYLTSLDTRIGVLVRRSSNETETAMLLVTLQQWWQKDWDEHGSHKVIYTPDPRSTLLVAPSTLRRVAVQLPMIGWERSRDVEQAFRTIRRMAEADEQDWMQIPGIGKGIARKVRTVINEGD